MIEVFMPKAGMDMQEGRVIKWLKEVGDHVELDEPIMEIETDKITMETESPGTGVLLSKLVPDDTVVPVLEVIGYIGEAGEQIPEKAAQKDDTGAKRQGEGAEVRGESAGSFGKSAEEAQKTAIKAQGDVMATPYAKALAREKGIELSKVAPGGKHGEIKAADVLNAKAKATPLAAKIAEDMGIDISSVAGSGCGGKVTKSDILSCAPEADEMGSAADETRVKMTAARRIIARRMSQSHTECPTVTQHMQVDITRLAALRKEINEGREAKISLNDMVLKAVAIAVLEFPEARTRIEGDEYVTKNAVNLGFAVGMEEGLLVPVIKNADKLSLTQISATAKDLALRARTNKIKPDELTGGVFTVSNMGMFDVYAFTPIINQPESGILGVCAAQDVLALDGERVIVKKMMMISLTYDHRIMDGTGSAAFERRIKFLLEHPLETLI